MKLHKTTQLFTSPLTWLVLLLLSFLVINPTAQATEPSFSISQKDIEQAVAEQLEIHGAGSNLNATVTGIDSRALVSSATPLSLTIEKLSFSKQTNHWEAECHIRDGQKPTQTLPITGRFEAMIEVPVVIRKMQSNEVITNADVQFKSVPEHHVNKDTVANVDELIGKSPKRSISEDRPIRFSEIMAPMVIKRGDFVQVDFVSQNMTIRTMGRAQESAALGDDVRIKNADSGLMIQAIATGPKMAAVNPPVPATANVASLH